MYAHMYIYIYIERERYWVYVYIHIYIYIYTCREIERGRESVLHRVVLAYRDALAWCKLLGAVVLHQQV